MEKTLHGFVNTVVYTCVTMNIVILNITHSLHFLSPSSFLCFSSLPSPLSPFSHSHPSPLPLPSSDRGGQQLQTLLSTPRVSEKREIFFEDRTKCHADHVDQGLEQQTTAAVGMLKAVHFDETFGGRRCERE